MKPMLCFDWDGRDLSGWLLSEKLDGCRATWDGEKLWTRTGSVIPAPRAFLDRLPRLELDGELWAGRGWLTEARVAAQYGRWTDRIRFAAFDMPAPMKVEARIETLASMRETESLLIVPHVAVESTEHALSAMADIVADGGEGVVLRRPNSDYVPKRCDAWLRLKPSILAKLEMEATR